MENPSNSNKNMSVRVRELLNEYEKKTRGFLVFKNVLVAEGSSTVLLLLLRKKRGTDVL